MNKNRQAVDQCIRKLAQAITEFSTKHKLSTTIVYDSKNSFVVNNTWSVNVYVYIQDGKEYYELHRRNSNELASASSAQGVIAIVFKHELDHKKISEPTKKEKAVSKTNTSSVSAVSFDSLKRAINKFASDHNVEIQLEEHDEFMGGHLQLTGISKPLLTMFFEINIVLDDEDNTHYYEILNRNNGRQHTNIKSTHHVIDIVFEGVPLKKKKSIKKAKAPHTKSVLDYTFELMQELREYAHLHRLDFQQKRLRHSYGILVVNDRHTIKIFVSNEKTALYNIESIPYGGLIVSSLQQVIDFVFHGKTTTEKETPVISKALSVCPSNYLANFLAGQITKLYTKAGHRVIEVADLEGVLPVLPEFEKHGIRYKEVSDFVLKGKYLVLVDNHLEMYNHASQVVTEYVDQDEESGLTTIGNKNPVDFQLVLNRDIVQLTRGVITDNNLSPKEKAIKLREIADELDEQKPEQSSSDEELDDLDAEADACGEANAAFDTDDEE